ncbi:hypothetical protein DOTSEDRAFT_24746 [Dothistroma septosporum NZE10]|uniref:Uncharacterized protein n=1 Tax=Dothistroma septosporum (strain NZE10 / CBS 128990) TaxID=675120 RepID=N1PQX0_DOTSN|nr:hypothetical protein DOTSEDRAFT_24746 [Dothistroma septosporum NZE10]
MRHTTSLLRLWLNFSHKYVDVGSRRMQKIEFNRTTRSLPLHAIILANGAVLESIRTILSQLSTLATAHPAAGYHQPPRTVDHPFEIYKSELRVPSSQDTLSDQEKRLSDFSNERNSAANLIMEGLVAPIARETPSFPGTECHHQNRNHEVPILSSSHHATWYEAGHDTRNGYPCRCATAEEILSRAWKFKKRVVTASIPLSVLTVGATKHYLSPAKSIDTTLYMALSAIAFFVPTLLHFTMDILLCTGLEIAVPLTTKRWTLVPQLLPNDAREARELGLDQSWPCRVEELRRWWKAVRNGTGWWRFFNPSCGGFLGWIMNCVTLFGWVLFEWYWQWNTERSLIRD